MGIKIGDIDLAKTILELEYQTKLNTILIEYIMTRSQSRGLFLQEDVEQFKRQAIQAINDKYGKEMLTIKKST